MSNLFFKYIYIIILLNVNLSFAQKTDSILVKGKIEESATGLAVPYAGIFIKHTTIGTISDSLGVFKLNISKDNLNDTLVVSSIGYSLYQKKIYSFKNLKKIEIYLNDSIYLLDEVVAIAYDYFETFEWESKRKKVKANYLTFSTNEKENVSSFIKVMRSQLGKYKNKDAFYRWKNVNIPNIGKGNKISLKHFKCPYCPNGNSVTVTIIIKDSRGHYPLQDESKKEILENFFQRMLNKTLDLGVDFTQLIKKNGQYYKKDSIMPYTGKTFGYFKNGQIGLKGYIKEGYKNSDWLYWYSNGQKKMYTHYNMGKKTGNWKYWYDNGNIRIAANYENNKMVGKNTWWFENGQKKKVSIYRKGVFISKTEWDSKGHTIKK